MASTFPTKSPTQNWTIPEIVNGNWTKKLIRVTVPNKCSLCSVQRTDVYNVNNKNYGHLIRAKCTKGCDESYESVRLQAEAYKGVSKNGEKVIPTSFFKPKFEPWEPSTRLGTGKTSQDGMNCSNKACNEFVPYAESNSACGKKFTCRKCRKN